MVLFLLRGAMMETVHINDKYCLKDRNRIEEITDYQIDSYEEIVFDFFKDSKCIKKLVI